MEREIEAARRAAVEAGKVLMSHYGSAEAREKKDGSLVTVADGESEMLIKRMLSEEFPGHSFLGEESGMDDRKSEFTWIVDPLDGTTNYSMKNPFFNVSIALVRGDEPVAGVVYSPVQNELFSAVKGGGAFLNGKAISVSGERDVSKALVAFCHGRDQKSVDFIASLFREFKSRSNNFRQMGAAALELAYVAAGRVDAFLSTGTNPWDVAAGALIVREAGGSVTDFSGGAYGTGSRDILAANSGIHPAVMEVVSAAMKGM